MRIFMSGVTPVLIIFIALALLCGIIFGFMYGFARLLMWLEPGLLSLIGFSIFLFLVAVTFSLVPGIRPRISALSITLSHVCGACTWLLSFMYIFVYLKWWSILLMWVFNITTPAAILILFVFKQFVIAGLLALAFAATYGMRLYGSWLASSVGNKKGREAFKRNDDEIIDAEFIEEK
jgi:hypothetical protein